MKCSLGAVFNALHDVPKTDPTTINENLKSEMRELREELKAARLTSERLAKAARLGEGLSARQLDIPEWSKLTHRPSSNDDAIVTAMLSDLHLDEVVDPKQVAGVNAYNRKIADKRLRKFFDSTLQLTFDHMKGIRVKGMVLPLGGDMFSGNIHEELRQTNEATIFESMFYWSEKIAAGITLLSKEFKSVHIPCVVGNHGRNSFKPIAKNRAQDNFDWALYHLMARDLKHLKNVTWDISEASDTLFTVYSTRFLLTHGDQFKGGSGIAGLLSPMMIGAHRKAKRQQAVRMPFDHMILGHWHQYRFLKDVIVNGSLKGYDEYAYQCNFDWEPPQQAYWLTQPNHGITISGPLHVLGSDERYLTN